MYKGFIVCMKSVIHRIHFTRMMFGKHYLSQT
nr:MAG TPA: hypothetical protein [Crassvirales sp.]